MDKIRYEDLLTIQEDMYKEKIPDEVLELFKHNSPPNHYRFLYLFVKKYQPEVIVELGTHWGISASAMAKGNPKATVHTIDIQKYDKHFNNDSNIKEYLGSSIDVDIVKQIPNQIELLFSDSGHSYELTVDEYWDYLPKMKDGGVIFFDDIFSAEGTKIFWDNLDVEKIVLYDVHLEFGFGAVIVRK